MIVLVAEAQPARLRDLVLALLDMDAGLRVCVKAPALLDVPAGATVLLRLRAEDSTWLNYTRPIFSERALRVVLWDEDGVTAAIKEEAPDFFDWISHVVTCPAGMPGFTVRGLQTAPCFPGVVWRGHDFERALAAAYPDAVSTAISARAPYADLVAAARQATGWLVCRDMASERDLVRLRWALAETGRVARCVLIEPEVDTPGWWPVSDVFAPWEEMLQQIGGDDLGAAALVAALLEREPGTGELAGALQQAGIGLAALATELSEQDDPGAALARLTRGHGLVTADHVIERRAAPAVLRAFEHDAEVEDVRASHAVAITAALMRWCVDSAPRDWFLEDAELLAWASTAPAEVLALPPERPPHWSSVYWLEATLGRKQPSRAAVAWARELELSDVVAYWKNVYGLEPPEPRAPRPQDQPARVVSKDHVSTLDVGWRLVALGRLLGDRGQHQRAERMLREGLDVLTVALGAEHPDVAAALDGLAKVLRAQGRYAEAEGVLRRALAITRFVITVRPGEVEREHALELLRDVRALAASNELGDMEMASGNLDAARAHYSAGRALATKLAAMEPGDAEAQRDLLAAELRLARLEVRAQKQADARRHLAAARAVLERIDAAGSLRGDALLEKYRQDLVEVARTLLP